MRPIDAVRALRERGVDQAEEMLELATPEQILMVCARADRRGNIGPGLIVKWIRERQFEDEVPVVDHAAQLRARFDDYAKRFPEGSVAEPHARLQGRKGYRVDCPGRLLVVDIPEGAIVAECDICGEEWSYTVRTLYLLGAPALTVVEPEAAF